MRDREGFEKWYTGFLITQQRTPNFIEAYDARQPEIDALNEQLGLCEGTLDSRNRNISTLLEESAVLKAKVKRYQIINTPETEDFILAIEREALHQRERWGSNNDAGKDDSDWFWLIGYLAGKAIRPDATPEKQLHHVITAAAACLNWHAAKLGVFTKMRPGIEEPPLAAPKQGLTTECFTGDCHHTRAVALVPPMPEGITPDPNHAVALALNGSLGEEQTKEILAYAGLTKPSAPEVEVERLRKDSAEGMPYGIIDPDYARIYSKVRCTAWVYGYAAMMHGSFTRDLDLLLVPWTDSVSPALEQKHLINLICDRCGLRENGHHPSVKPHGRTVYTLMFQTFGDPRFIDVGFMPVAIDAE